MSRGSGGVNSPTGSADEEGLESSGDSIGPVGSCVSGGLLVVVWTFEEEEEEASQEVVRQGRYGSSMGVEMRMNHRWAHWETDFAAAVDAAAAGEAAAAAVASAVAVESSCCESDETLAQVGVSWCPEVDQEEEEKEE